MVELDPEKIVARVQGRQGWLREARRQLDEHRRLQAIADSALSAGRLWDSEQHLREDLTVELGRMRPMRPIALAG